MSAALSLRNARFIIDPQSVCGHTSLQSRASYPQFLPTCQAQALITKQFPSLIAREIQPRNLNSWGFILPLDHGRGAQYPGLATLTADATRESVSSVRLIAVLMATPFTIFRVLHVYTTLFRV